jgi:hypothetical protein
MAFIKLRSLWCVSYRSIFTCTKALNFPGMTGQAEDILTEKEKEEKWKRGVSV